VIDLLTTAYWVFDHPRAVFFSSTGRARDWSFEFEVGTWNASDWTNGRRGNRRERNGTDDASIPRATTNGTERNGTERNERTNERTKRRALTDRPTDGAFRRWTRVGRDGTGRDDPRCDCEFQIRSLVSSITTPADLRRPSSKDERRATDATDRGGRLGAIATRGGGNARGCAER